MRSPVHSGCKRLWQIEFFPRYAAPTANAKACRAAAAAAAAEPPLSPRRAANLLAAVSFVLDVSNSQLRAEDRKALLHEGAGTHVMSAYVEVHFDNSDGRMPIDREEVRRRICLSGVGLRAHLTHAASCRW